MAEPALDREDLPYNETYCANHPKRQTGVRCSSCGKPICPDCMVFSPVGVKCRDCARLPKSARITFGADKAARAIGAALAAGTLAGFVYYFVLAAAGFFFFVIFAAAAIGYVVGEAVLRASRYYHGTETAVIAVVGTIWAFVFPPLLDIFMRFGVSWDGFVFGLTGRGVMNWIIMFVAGYFAWQRNR